MLTKGMIGRIKLSTNVVVSGGISNVKVKGAYNQKFFQYSIFSIIDEEGINLWIT